MRPIAPILAFVFRPGGVACGNVYTDWAVLVGELNSVDGRKMLEFDDSLESPCRVPAGTWKMSDVVWAGYGPRPGATRSVVAIENGAILQELRMIGGQITIDNQANTVSPISDFVDGAAGANHVQIGMRDDCGNTQIFNSGDAPLFDLGSSTPAARSVFFFVQNTLLGIRTDPGVNPPPPKPLITHNNVRCIINFIGQNQTGNNLLKPPATAIFGALSSATQIGTSNIAVDHNTFGPVTRIQRKVVPQPPAAPATTRAQIEPISLPNVLLRCNGQGAFVVPLPNIKTGFSFAMQDRTPLYTGGQEIVVAEVVGGHKLSVRAAAGNTIDGSAAPVSIRAHESRIFASDGESNWITIASDLNPPTPPAPHPQLALVKLPGAGDSLIKRGAGHMFVFDLPGFAGEPCMLHLNVKRETLSEENIHSMRLECGGAEQVSVPIENSLFRSLHIELTNLQESTNQLLIQITGPSTDVPTVFVSDMFVIYRSLAV
ncbi:MAG: hypothetical protein QOK17_2263 [Sphingomonadales bacterium]|jgi:hypothetical protein|nr:hypothetical protein [Sphingomonadales bacterium]